MPLRPNSNAARSAVNRQQRSGSDQPPANWTTAGEEAMRQQGGSDRPRMRADQPVPETESGREPYGWEIRKALESGSVSRFLRSIGLDPEDPACKRLLKDVQRQARKPDDDFMTNPQAWQKELPPRL